jgi:hypothetical protein
MKSIKGGRAPSLMGAIVSFAFALFGIVFVVFMVSQMLTGPFRSDNSGAVVVFIAFGILWLVVTAGSGIYQLYNFKAKNRPSVIDITDGNEEPDPLNEYFHGKYDVESTDAPAAKDGMYCPYCGKPIQADFAFCSHCGKELKK